MKMENPPFLRAISEANVLNNISFDNLWDLELKYFYTTPINNFSLLCNVNFSEIFIRCLLQVDNDEKVIIYNAIILSHVIVVESARSYLRSIDSNKSINIAKLFYRQHDEVGFNQYDNMVIDIDQLHHRIFDIADKICIVIDTSDTSTVSTHFYKLMSSVIISMFILVLNLNDNHVLTKMTLLKCVKLINSTNKGDLAILSDDTTHKSVNVYLQICTNILNNLRQSTSLQAFIDQSSQQLIQESFGLHHKQSSLDAQNLVVRSLIYPMLRLLHEAFIQSKVNSIDLSRIIDDMMIRLWDYCQVRRCESRAFDQLESSSGLLCTCFAMESLNPFVINSLYTRTATPPVSESSIHFYDLFDVILAMFSHHHVVTRKRGAFLLQTLSESAKGSSTLNMKKMSSSRKHQNHDNEVKVLIDSPPVLMSHSSWWDDYLTVYHQVEGCNSLHLVKQIYPLLDELCHEATRSHTTTEGCTVSRVSFAWVKALIHILLRVSMPGIRKAVVYRLFNATLPFRVTKEYLDWIFFELFG
jgi:hypothetical protein